jgi:hypothetical protein
MPGIRALATFPRFWHAPVRAAYHHRRRIVAQITRSRPLAVTCETLFDPNRASPTSNGFAVTFSFIANGTRTKWVRKKSPNFSPI